MGSIPFALQIDENSRRAKRMITEFSEFLRYSLLRNNSEPIPLREEIDAIRNYLAVEKIRFEDRPDVTFDIESAIAEFPIPSFLIHPPIENAIKHGLTPTAVPLKITLTAQAHDNRLRIEVTNTGQWRDSAPAQNGE